MTEATPIEKMVQENAELVKEMDEARTLLLSIASKVRTTDNFFDNPEQDAINMLMQSAGIVDEAALLIESR